MSRGKIFFWSGLAFLAGVLADSVIDLDQIVVGVFAVSGIILVCLNKKTLVIGLMIVLVGLGMYRLQLARERPENHVSAWNDQAVALSGIITLEPDEREESTRLTLAVEEAGGEPAAGRVLIFVPRYPVYEYGQKLRVKGKLQTPENFADFDYQNYLARYGVYSTMYQPPIEVIGSGGNPVMAGLLAGKKRLVNSIERLIPEPEAGFALGILLGQQAAVGEATQNAFRASGTMHVMAVSGYNITIVASLLIAASRRAGRRWSFLIAIIGIGAFVLITGASASVVRAALMGGLVLLSQQTGRVSSVRNVLVAAAVIMVAINPLVLRFDIGFQLSFLAVVGLVYVGPRLEKFLTRVPKALLLRESLTATLSANAMTLPITLVYFGQISPLAPLINVILLPSIPIAMGMSFVTALVGLLDPILGQLATYPTWLILTYGIKVVKWGASLPGATLLVEKNLAWLALLGYGVIAGLLGWPKIKKAFQLSKKRKRFPRADASGDRWVSVRHRGSRFGQSMVGKD